MVSSGVSPPRESSVAEDAESERLGHGLPADPASVVSPLLSGADGAANIAAATVATRSIEQSRPLSMTLSTKIALGLASGVAIGLFLGELASGFSIVASGYVGLLQTTVLPYVTVSLILGLGRLTYPQACALFTKVGGVLLAMWAVALLLVFALPLTFPAWESASFYSTALIEQPEDVDFLSLYIPANPFFSLANSMVPARSARARRDRG